MITAELIVDSRRASKKGFPVRVRAYCNNAKVHRYVRTNIYQKSKSIKNTYEVVERMSSLQREIDFVNRNKLKIDEAVKVFKEGVSSELEIDFLKKRLRELEQSTSIPLLEFLAKDIESRQKKGMATYAFESLMRELLNFGADKNTSIKDVDYAYARRFIEHKKMTTRSKTGGDGAVSFYVRTASTLFNEAIRMGVTKDNPWRGHRIKRKRTTTLLLPTWEMLKPIWDYKGTPQQERALGIFRFLLEIGGHYPSEIYGLKIERGRVRFNRRKNRSKEGGGEFVDNMATDFVLKFDRSIAPDPKNVYPMKRFRDNNNKVLRVLSKNLGITPKLQLSMPRYLVASAATELGIDEVVKNQLMGHKNQKVSQGYVGRMPYSKLDYEHQRILDKIIRGV